MNSTHFALLKLHLTPGLGRTGLFKLKRYFNDYSAALNASARQWQQAGLTAKLHDRLQQQPDGHTEKIAYRMQQQGVRIIAFDDSDYPALLRTIHDPPALLYLLGQLPQQDCFAIVGSRKATAGGLATTEQLSMQLAQHDICIVSGLARGIDSAAHRGALQAGGRTIAVSGCGIDRVYPPENRRLHSEIIRANAVITEYPPGTPPLAGHFPGRNRIISGISHGVLIVEAAHKSGSLITGDFALEQGRELFAIPGAVHNKFSQGTNSLLKEGAQLVTECNDILHNLWPGRLSRPQQQRLDSFADQLDRQTAEIYSLLSFDPLHSDDIARTTGLTPMELSVILLDLELLGGITVLPGNRYVRTRL